MIARLALALGATLLLSTAPLPDGIEGVWANPHNSVHVRYEKCGKGALCGTVVWASDKAKADAKRGGTDELVGTQIFRNLYKDGPNRWKGKVFVPDIRKTFAGTVTIEGDKMVGRGCLVLGVGCKSQTWTRIQD
ncbi:DUF2147 domain-containing protein [Sphingomonas sp. HITSZ_GF]|uniref:DUF2147 domain-containing protein n=1 Tax=Sphingomonas sp. HITSZ_GF TaxID=3037247 RepID=UPI00240E7C0A|nr:DUF2147 domain-containing protein [Sphingomonas sp. HITSZ_GF]MDG2533604.1 DUF2147 domain-containing protein [Sphingomonas sp. HITSZ_GF]